MTGGRRSRPPNRLPMQAIHPAIEPTEDGSPTLRHPVFGETYHSLHGAVAEARHVFIAGGLKRCPLPHVHILEAGFGSGLNAWLTLREAEESGRTVWYTAVEAYPVDIRTAEALRYADDPLFGALHRAPWGEPTEITPRFRLEKRAEDLVFARMDAIFDIIYFDAFAPDTQPELWTEGLFRKLFAQTAPGGALVTYSAKGTVKRALRAAGYEVTRLPGAPGKRHMVRAVRPRKNESDANLK